jgi:hypothetical protein
MSDSRKSNLFVDDQGSFSYPSVIVVYSPKKNNKKLLYK